MPPGRYRAVKWVLAAAVIVFIYSQPTVAAHVVTHAGMTFGNVVNRLGRFVSQLGQ